MAGTQRPLPWRRAARGDDDVSIGGWSLTGETEGGGLTVVVLLSRWRPGDRVRCAPTNSSKRTLAESG